MWRRIRPGKAESAIKGTMSGACFQLPVLGFVLWFLWRGDAENRELARIGVISAIVGVGVSIVSSILLTVLSSLGIFNPSEILPEIFQGADAAFIYFGFFR